MPPQRRRARRPLAPSQRRLRNRLLPNLPRGYTTVVPDRLERTRMRPQQ
jgi:hypothetical protein